MIDLRNELKICNVCSHEYTSIHVEAMPGQMLYICDTCLEAAKYNFIWVCLNCGKSYLRSKELVRKRMNGSYLTTALHLDECQLVQGVTVCIACDPHAILRYMNERKN